MSYWDNICEIEKKQTEKGLATYGQTLEENIKLDPIERITMFEEELVDALKYAEHIKTELIKIHDQAYLDGFQDGSRKRLDN